MQVPINVTIDQLVPPIAAEGATGPDIAGSTEFLLNLFVPHFAYISHISHVFYSCQLQEAIIMLLLSNYSVTIPTPGVVLDTDDPEPYQVAQLNLPL